MSSEIITIISIIIAIVTTIIAAIALYYSSNQTRLLRNTIQASTFVTVVNTAREIQFSHGMDIIRSLKYSSYDEFKVNVPLEEQEQIRAVIDFLNDLRHMVRHDYLTEEHILNIYFVSIMDCNKYLLPWWLDGFRKENNSRYYYLNFEQLCRYIQLLGSDKLIQWNKKGTLG